MSLAQISGLVHRLVPSLRAGSAGENQCGCGGNPLTSRAAIAASTATEATSSSPQLAAPTAAGTFAIAATASSLTSTAASSEPSIYVVVAPSSHGSSGAALVVKSNSSDSAGLIFPQSSSEITGVAGLANSASSEREWSTSLTNNGVSSISDAATFLERQTAIVANGIGELLHRDAVAAAFADADVLEWAASTPASQPSAADVDISLLADDLLDAIGHKWRN